jgi:PII-like signaling protein
MATQSVTVVRIYVREGEHAVVKLMKFLQNEAKVAGATVLRGTSGFGADGKTHTSSLLALSLDLPEIVEFYDTPQRVDAVLTLLEDKMSLPHIISWPALVHLPPTTKAL